MIPGALANHLWQSTVFAAACAAVVFALRKNRAAVRHGIWLAASMKFLIPFSLLMTAGNELGWRTAPNAVPALAPSAAIQISQPFSEIPLAWHPMATNSRVPRTVFWLAVSTWLTGSFAVLGLWFARWRPIRAMLRTAISLPLEMAIPVRSASAVMEPGVFGILRPVLLLPEGISERLTPEQLGAILTHELCHVRRRDNLTAAFHMAIEAMFWFHPLVWWLGARLVDERERACDEEVLRSGSEREAYAEGILNVCKFYLRSPLVCTSGVTGSDLKKRIEAIMTDRIPNHLTGLRKLMLTAAGLTAISAPVVIGVLHAQDPNLVFEVASIKPAQPDDQGSFFRLLPGGGLSIHNGTLRQFITFAYDIQDFQLSGGPAWLASAAFDIVAKPEHPEGPTDEQNMTDAEGRTMMARQRIRLRALLSDRFHLAIHRDSKELPVYVLVPGKNGVRLKDAAPGGTMHLRHTRGLLDAASCPTDLLANSLTVILRRTVLDRTGLTGKYDFKLEWTPEAALSADPAPTSPIPADPTGPTLFSAIQEQLGLRLEAGKGPVKMIVIDRAEKPTAN